MKTVLHFMLGGKGLTTTSRVVAMATGIWIVVTGVFLAIPAAAPYALFPTRAYLAVVYIFLLFRLAGWVRRNVALLQERFRDKGIRGIFKP